MLVLLFHAGFGFPGGFVGVDVFFVISGFLITGLILKEQQESCFSLKKFWIRRIRRILPASTLVVGTVLLVGSFILLPYDFSDLAKSAVAQQCMLSNVFFWKHSGYFSGAADLQSLLHTWSLAVEEQFYLVYPLLLILLGGRSKSVIVSVLAAITVGSLVASEYGARNHASATFYFLPTRAWELLVGALLSFVPKSLVFQPRLREWLSLFGLTGILVAAVCFTQETRFPGVSALLPCIGAALLIIANGDELSLVGRVLASSPFVAVGKISYSLYLWHWPILALLRHLSLDGNLDLQSRFLALFVTCVLAILSTRLIELPLRKQKLFPQPKQMLAAVGGAGVLVIIVSLYIAVQSGIPSRFSPQVYYYDSAKDSKAFVNQMTLSDVLHGRIPEFGESSAETKCLIWGDSHAMALIPGLDSVCKDQDLHGFQVTAPQTSPILDFVTTTPYGLNEQAPEFNRAVLEFAKSRDVRIVVLAAVWSSYGNKSPETFRTKLTETVEQLTSAGIEVAIVLDVARQDKDVPAMLSLASRLGRDVTKLGVPGETHAAERYVCEHIVREICESHAHVRLLDPAPYLVDENGLWRAEYEGKAMYWDKDHLTIEGSLRVSPMFKEFFVDVSNHKDRNVRIDEQK